MTFALWLAGWLFVGVAWFWFQQGRDSKQSWAAMAETLASQKDEGEAEQRMAMALGRMVDSLVDPNSPVNTKQMLWEFEVATACALRIAALQGTIIGEAEKESVRQQINSATRETAEAYREAGVATYRLMHPIVPDLHSVVGQ